MRQPEQQKIKSTVASDPSEESIPTHLYDELQSKAESLPPQTVIGRYELMDRLGAGSYGVVYRASDSTLRRLVAIKLLTRFESEQEIDGWLGEARVLAGLDHPSIVPVYDIGRTDIGQPYIVSKFIAGGTLSSRLAKDRVDCKQAIAWVIQLAEALGYLHHRHVMHRDVKPGNILLTEDSLAVLADFGLALPEERYGKGARFVGTPAYMSPEQARREGHRVDGRSDIYSLGVVLYELLTGQRPFRANNQEELLECIRTVEVRPPRQLNADVPRELERICLKALAKKVVDRYATAGDMAEELRGWTQVSLVTGAPSKATLVDTVGVASENGVRSTELSNIVVVPHGLRPFDAHDADFFKFLLPGARDRYGVPDSINFWSSRILSRQTSDAFRVGVLLGPSGSGKSSLVRAGILPLVGDSVHHVFVEAKPEGLEAALLKQIAQRLPHLKLESNLVDTLIRFRQTPSHNQDGKLLIVIDQFEQWLNTHRDGGITPLHDALRQCDGMHLQALLLVRDDFMLGLSNFMDEIEEPILQNKNFATMERFGPAHARSVLSAFGRAYGALQDVTSGEQEAFLDLVVDELGRVGSIEPVHLALLAEMIKDKPWNRATFRALGGLQGLGVSFLEDRLAGPGAHPLLRSEIQTVRRVLAELLPPDDTVIKPQPCTEQMLVDRLSGLASPETIDKVLNLLDTEVRLITPTSGAMAMTNSANGSTGSTNSVVPAYQLTHDYLVPTIRKWLTAAEEGTRAGRVRVLLRDLSASWNATPSIKRLPSLGEWMSIRWFTKPGHWSQAERRMMRALEKRLGVFALGLSGVIATGWFAYRQANWRMQVDTYSTRLLEADTSRVAEVLEEMGSYRASVAQKLNSLGSPLDQSLAPQQRFHLALLQLEQPNAQQQVIENLKLVDDGYLAPIVDYVTRRYEQEGFKGLEQQVTSALIGEATNKSHVLPLTALLARLNTDAATRPAILQQLGPLLASKNHLDVGHWTGLLKPIKDPLIAELLHIGASGQLSGEGADNYVSMILSLAADDAETLAKVICWAPIERIKRIVEQPRNNARLAIAVRQKMNELRNPAADSPSAIDPAAEKLLTSLGGVVKSNCAWAESIPWNRLDECVTELQKSSYCPVSVRPYSEPTSASPAQLETCVVWHKSDMRPTIKRDMSFEELKQQFDQLQSERMLLVDLARYQVDDQARWIGLWHQALDNSEVPQQRLEMQSPKRGDDDDQLSGEEQKFQIIRSVDWLDEKSDVQLLNLYRRREQPLRSVNWSRVSRANGDIYPNCRTVDIRGQWTFDQSERGKLWRDIHYYLEDWQAGKQLSPSSVASTARRLLAVNRPELAKPLIDALTDELIDKESASTQAELQKLRTCLQLQLALETHQGEIAQSLVQSLQELEAISDSERAFWQLRTALATRGVTAIDMSQLELLSAAAQSKKDDELRYLKILALLATQVPDAPAAEKLGLPPDAPLSKKCLGAMAELLSKARAAMERDRLSQEFLEVEFDGLRSQAQWRSLMQAQQLTERWSVAAVPALDIAAHCLYPESSTTHGPKALSIHARGFMPVAWHVMAGPGQRKSMSAWQRLQLPTDDPASQAESRAKLVLALAHLGEDDALQEVLAEKEGRGQAIYVALNAWRTIPAEAFVKLLKKSDALPVQLNSIMALGNYPLNTISDETRDYVRLRLREWAAGTSRATLMNHARWCLGKWNEALPEIANTQDAAAFMSNQVNNKSTTDWFVNSLGQQMIAIDANEQVGLGNDYKRVWVRIQRKFAIGATEVTGQQMQEFIDDPRVQRWMLRQKSDRRFGADEGQLPQAKVSWLMAIMYSQWLNEREMVPADQWCYRNVFNDDDSLPVAEPNYLQRTGYRLPTYAEWVVACQAQSAENWHFGSDLRAANNFEWSQANAEEEPHEVARLLPNHFGLYDMGGNLAEWTDSLFRPPMRDGDHYWLDDSENQDVRVSSYAYQLGGRFTLSPASMSHRVYKVNMLNYMSTTSGLRLARTIAK